MRTITFLFNSGKRTLEFENDFEVENYLMRLKTNNIWYIVL